MTPEKLGQLYELAEAKLWDELGEALGTFEREELDETLGVLQCLVYEIRWCKRA